MFEKNGRRGCGHCVCRVDEFDPRAGGAVPKTHARSMRDFVSSPRPSRATWTARAAAPHGEAARVPVVAAVAGRAATAGLATTATPPFDCPKGPAHADLPRARRRRNDH